MNKASLALVVGALTLGVVLLVIWWQHGGGIQSITDVNTVGDVLND